MRKYNWPTRGPDSYDGWTEEEGFDHYLGDGVSADSRLLEGYAWLCTRCEEDEVVHEKYNVCCHCGMTKTEAEQP